MVILVVVLTVLMCQYHKNVSVFFVLSDGFIGKFLDFDPRCRDFSVGLFLTLLGTPITIQESPL